MCPTKGTEIQEGTDLKGREHDQQRGQMMSFVALYVGPSIAASPPITENTHRADRSLPLTNKRIQSAFFILKTGALRIFRIISISISREQFLQQRGRNFLGELQ